MLKQLTDKCRSRLTVVASTTVGFFQENEAPFFLPHIMCADNVILSVQANRVAVCHPQGDGGPYTHVEVGFPESPHVLKDLPPEWQEYKCDDGIFCSRTATLG